MRLQTPCTPSTEDWKDVDLSVEYSSIHFSQCSSCASTSTGSHSSSGSLYNCYNTTTLCLDETVRWMSKLKYLSLNFSDSTVNYTIVKFGDFKSLRFLNTALNHEIFGKALMQACENGTLDETIRIHGWSPFYSDNVTHSDHWRWMFQLLPHRCDTSRNTSFNPSDAFDPPKTSKTLQNNSYNSYNSNVSYTLSSSHSSRSSHSSHSSHNSHSLHISHDSLNSRHSYNRPPRDIFASIPDPTAPCVRLSAPGPVAKLEKVRSQNDKNDTHRNVRNKAWHGANKITLNFQCFRSGRKAREQSPPILIANSCFFRLICDLIRCDRIGAITLGFLHCKHSKIVSSVAGMGSKLTLDLQLLSSALRATNRLREFGIVSTGPCGPDTPWWLQESLFTLKNKQLGRSDLNKVEKCVQHGLEGNYSVCKLFIACKNGIYECSDLAGELVAKVGSGWTSCVLSGTTGRKPRRRGRTGRTGRSGRVERVQKGASIGNDGNARKCGDKLDSPDSGDLGEFGMFGDLGGLENFEMNGADAEPVGAKDYSGGYHKWWGWIKMRNVKCGLWNKFVLRENACVMRLEGEQASLNLLQRLVWKAHKCHFDTAMRVVEKVFLLQNLRLRMFVNKFDGGNKCFCLKCCSVLKQRLLKRMNDSKFCSCGCSARAGGADGSSNFIHNVEKNEMETKRMEQQLKQLPVGWIRLSVGGTKRRRTQQTLTKMKVEMGASREHEEKVCMTPSETEMQGWDRAYYGVDSVRGLLYPFRTGRMELMRRGGGVEMKGKSVKKKVWDGKIDVLKLQGGEMGCGDKIERLNRWSGQMEMFDEKQVFTSPSIKYASHPANAKFFNVTNPYKLDEVLKAQFVFEVKHRPGSYRMGQETVGNGKEKIDDKLDNDGLEWYTTEGDIENVVICALLVRFFNFNVQSSTLGCCENSNESSPIGLERAQRRCRKNAL